MDREGLSPAERIINTLLAQSDQHMVHNRPGVVIPDARTSTGARWHFVTHKEEEDGQKVVYRLDKMGFGRRQRTSRVRIGTMNGAAPDGSIPITGPGGAVIGRYQPAGIYPEVAVWLYKSIAEVWKLDNEFAARWASHAYKQDHKDLKVALCAFMLVQSRKGDPVMDEGKLAFLDDDYRDVGEAMMLLYERDAKHSLNPKLLLRVRDLLRTPEIAQLNYELGFSKTDRKPFLGRWSKAVTKWLHFREENTRLLEGLVKAGMRTSVIELAKAVGFKPKSPRFFEVLRWKQEQAKWHAARTIAVGEEVVAAESWEDLDERAICERIEKDRPNWKRIVGLLPSSVGVTRAVMAAAIEAGSLSDKDLVIQAPTIEELGLLEVQEIRERWQAALAKAEDMRAANIAKRMKTQEASEALEEAADTAMKAAVAEVMRGIRLYFQVDISGSMTQCIERAKAILKKFLQGFPPDQIHVSVFNTAGRVIEIRHASAAGVENAFRGIGAGGGTDYGEGIRVLQQFRPKDDEDVIFFYVGDEGHNRDNFARAVEQSGLNPVAFGLVRVDGGWMADRVQRTAAMLGIPCFIVDEDTFDDVYAIPRTIRNLIAATPVREAAFGARAQPRQSLIDIILKTELLKKPAWAG